MEARTITMVLALVLIFFSKGFAGRISMGKARKVAENWLYQIVKTRGLWGGMPRRSAQSK